MDVAKISDLELAKALSENQETLTNVIANINILKAELNKRMESQNAKSDTATE